jgi:hypothetical protein
MPSKRETGLDLPTMCKIRTYVRYLPIAAGILINPSPSIPNIEFKSTSTIHRRESALHTLSPYVYGTTGRRTNFIANLRPCAHLPAASLIQAISQRSKRDVPGVCSLAVGSFEEIERFQEGSVEGYQSEEDGGCEI